MTESLDAFEAIEQNNKLPNLLGPGRYTTQIPGRSTDSLTPNQLEAANSIKPDKALSPYKIHKDIDQLINSGYKVEFYDNMIYASKDPRRSGIPWNI